MIFNMAQVWAILWQVYVESAKLRALRSKNVLNGQRAFRAYVLTCKRVLSAYVLTYQRASHSYVLTYQRVLRDHMLTCQCVLRAYVLICLACLRYNVLCALTCSWEKPRKMYKVYTQTCLAFSCSPVLIHVTNTFGKNYLNSKFEVSKRWLIKVG